MRGKPVPIPPKQAELLHLFLSNPQRLLSRDTIHQKVWPDTVVEFDQSLNFAIKSLRKVLNDNAQSARFIETIPRKGYRFMVVPKAQNRQQISNHPKKTQSFARWLLGLSIGTVAAVFLGIWYSIPGNSSSTIPTGMAMQPQSSALQRANYVFAKSRTGAYRDSIPLYQQHLQQHPQDGRAHALLAIANIKTRDAEADTAVITLQLEKARLYQPEGPETQLAQALFELYIQWDVIAAHQHAVTAMKAKPDWVLGWHELAVMQLILNKKRDALESIKRLMDLAPGVALERFHAGWFYQVNGRPRLALEQYQHSLQINNQQPYTHLFAALVAAELGMTAHERTFLRGFLTSLKLDTTESEKLLVAADASDAKAIWHWWQQWLSTHRAPYFSQALAYAITADRDNTIAALSRAIEKRENMIPTVFAFNQFSFLWNDPEFKTLTKPIRR